LAYLKAMLFSALIIDAQALCGMRSIILDNLKTKYGEVVVGDGLASGHQHVVELLVSPSGSWSILTSLTSGMSCIVSTGDDWVFPQPAPPDLGDEL
jgi:hypothetical protein